MVVKWIPLLMALLVDLLIASYLLEDYPKAMYPEKEPEQKREVYVSRLAGPNTSSVEEQIAHLSLTGRPFCIDYRTLNQTHILVEPGDPSGSEESRQDAPARNYKKLRLEDIRSVKKFVFFVGYSRSGHSIVGSLLDAHPNIIMAHEYNLFRQWDKAPEKHFQRAYLYKELLKNSVDSAVSGWRSKQKDVKGYTLGMTGQWQADFKELLVIGDKSGAVTTQIFKSNQERFLEILRELKRSINVPIRVIHVVRNPYDIISTKLLYADAGKGSKLNATAERKHCNNYGLHYHTNRTFRMVGVVQNLLEKTNLTALDVHLADLVSRPRDTMATMCRFLNLACSQDYLEACERKVFARLSRSRLLVHWPRDLVEEVHRLAMPYRFLWRYSFNGD